MSEELKPTLTQEDRALFHDNPNTDDIIERVESYGEAMARWGAQQAKLKPLTDNKLWLWKNFVDGKPEYWAFDNPFPIHLDNGDPQTLGEPCGYAIFKPSRVGRTDVSEAQVLERIKRAKDMGKPKPLTDERIVELVSAHAKYQEEGYVVSGWLDFARAIERELTGEKT